MRSTSSLWLSPRILPGSQADDLEAAVSRRLQDDDDDFLCCVKRPNGEGEEASLPKQWR